ncbi:uncharacterized protein plekho2 [Polymixia lowei]
MEDGAKEDPVQPKEPKFLGKAGWVKKATGRMLAGYKDRYIHVEKTEIVVYEAEDLQTCLERLDLENYDKCLELRSVFKKKNRLVLIRAPKSGNKAHDVKFQAPTPEEKDAWIKALRDGISRAKNKIFDEVKVDESNNLDHVTRTRPKGNRNRRPPTRIHMKEVASVSSDGALRLDLDLPDATMPNGTHYVHVDTTDSSKETVKPPMPPSKASEDIKEEQPGFNADEEPQTETEPSPQKKVIKPPMPPSKEAKPVTTSEAEPSKEDGQKKVLKPPMPPSKEAKPIAPPVEESTEEASIENMSEKSPEARKETGPPPTPPNKPISNSTEDLTEASQPRLDPQPPSPPSKDKKPSHPVEHENKEKKAERVKNDVPWTVDEMDASLSNSKEGLPDVKEEPVITDSTESSTSASKASPEESESASGNGTDNAHNNELQKSPQLNAVTSSTRVVEPIKKSPGPPTSPKKKLVKPHPPKTGVPFEPENQPTEEEETAVIEPQEKPTTIASLQTASDTSVRSPNAEEALILPVESRNDFPAVVVTLNDSVADGHGLGALPCCLHAEKKEKVEEKSVDSGQHSDDDDSEGSDSGDRLAASTVALRGSHAGLDVFYVSEDDTETPDSLGQITDEEPPAVTEASVSLNVKPTFSQVKNTFRPSVPLKPSAKARSASIGDLLSNASGKAQVRQPTRGMVLSDGAAAYNDDMMNLEKGVALELEQTEELLTSVSQSQREGVVEGMPEDLLAKAMEKLRMADNFLREAKNLKESTLMKNISKRNSW